VRAGLDDHSGLKEFEPSDHARIHRNSGFFFLSHADPVVRFSPSRSQAIKKISFQKNHKKKIFI
jgi:hypothetical protein